jgi:hypothetical protein
VQHIRVALATRAAEADGTVDTDNSLNIDHFFITSIRVVIAKTLSFLIDGYVIIDGHFF